ncbi:MAG: ATP-binding protein [Ignavibacteria bacterium]|nr:ATP-binding protein [Ignavibacteria bacterium]
MNNKIKIQIEKRFRSTTENLDKIREFITNSISSLNLSDEELSNIVLAVDEACTNVIKHAYHFSPEGEIIINLNYSNSKLDIRVIDSGNGFDPNSVPTPDIREFYKSHKIGGLGIHLMKKLMDKVDFDFKPGFKNEVILTKYLKHTKDNLENYSSD